jgi:hypothetical protein
MPFQHSTIAIITALLVVLILACPPKSLAADQITISGTGYTTPFMNHPQISVVVRDKSTMMLLGTATTDVNGNYEVNFYPVGIQNYRRSGLSSVILRNPYQEILEMRISAKETGTYSLSVSEINGSVILSKTISLHSGDNRLTISGLGSAGMKTILISGYGQKITLKVIQEGSTVFSPSVDGSRPDISLLKNSATSDSLLVSFIPPSGYTGMDTTVSFQSQTVNYALQQVPIDTVDFVIKPYTINGDTINNLTLEFQFPDGLANQFEVDTDGFIHVHQNLYSSPPYTAIVTHNADTATYALYQFFRKTDRNLMDTNYAQSPKPNTSTPPQPTQLVLSGIPDTLELYLLHTQIPTPSPLISEYGTTIRYDHPEVKWIMNSLNLGASSKYIPVPSISEKVIHFQFTWDLSTGQQVSSIDLQFARDERDHVRMVFTLNNGKTIFPPDTTATIASINDPLYLLLAARSWSQTAQTNYAGATEGLVLYSYNNTSNGEPIISYSISEYPIIDQSQIFPTCVFQYFIYNFPYNSGQTLSEWTKDQTTGFPTQFFYEIGRTTYIANQGTYF